MSTDYSDARLVSSEQPCRAGICARKGAMQELKCLLARTMAIASLRKGEANATIQGPRKMEV